MNTRYRRDRIRRHLLFTQAHLRARARDRVAHHPRPPWIPGPGTLDRIALVALVAVVALAGAAGLLGASPRGAPTGDPAPSSPPPAPPAATAPAVGMPRAATPVPSPPAGPVWVVRQGDTLARIAVRTGVAADRIAALNHLPDPDRIITGHALRLPAPDPAAVVIAPGDTLTGCAHTHRVGVRELRAANPALADPDRIQAGSALRLLGGRTPPAAPSGGGRHAGRGSTAPGCR